MPTTIDIKDLTSNVQTTINGTKHEVTGDGIFDDLMETVNQHADAQFAMGRIKGTEYAEFYLGALQSALAQSVQFTLQREAQAAQVDLATAQKDELLLNGVKDRLTKDAQTALVKRQTKGFDDDAKQKLLKQTLDSWSVAYSVAQDANSIPDTIKVNSIDSVMKNAMDSLSITVTNDPIGEA